MSKCVDAYYPGSRLMHAGYEFERVGVKISFYLTKFNVLGIFSLKTKSMLSGMADGEK